MIRYMIPKGTLIYSNQYESILLPALILRCFSAPLRSAEAFISVSLKNGKPESRFPRNAGKASGQPGKEPECPAEEEKAE